ncbi:MAG TPA: LLM class flavin-dependent oxidoreductase [Candidatus Limnocylindrales bacterium]|nr:LLM class flavin-dependent oxidoreductase [Candidatus Limnocylindrales bacterium]
MSELETGAADLRERIGRVGVWGHLDSFDAPTARAYAARADQLGYGALWVPETVGREPFALLAVLAGATERLTLGTSIASIWARDAQTARMAALTIQEASGGRFVLGLGVSHPHLAERLRGHHYEKPLTRMREYLATYRAAVWKGPAGPGDAGLREPPVLLAALRERMLDLAATEASGAFPYLVTPERVASMRARLDGAGPGHPAGHGPGDPPEDSPRDPAGDRPVLAVTLPVVLAPDPADGAAREAARAYLAPYLRPINYQASWALQGFDEADWAKPGSDRLVEAMVAIGPPQALRARIAALHAAGADHVAVIPLAPDGATEHLPTLEDLAASGPHVV